jgi:hypothetical protein
MEPFESQDFPVLRLESNENPPELVSIVQQKLGVPEERIDGVFDSLTDAAVRQFQELSGLNVDGVVGAVTWSAMGCEMVEGNIMCDATSFPGDIVIHVPPPDVHSHQNHSSDELA